MSKRHRSTFRRRGGKPFSQAERARAELKPADEEILRHRLDEIGGVFASPDDGLLRHIARQTEGLIDALNSMAAELQTYMPRDVDAVVVDMTGPDDGRPRLALLGPKDRD